MYVCVIGTYDLFQCFKNTVVLIYRMYSFEITNSNLPLWCKTHVIFIIVIVKI